MTELMRSWSHSSAVTYRECKYRAYLKHVKRVPEPERELPQGKSEHANDRGSRIHDACEQFVRGNGKFIPEMRHFHAEFHHMRDLFKAGLVSLEGEWGMDEDWNPAPWKTAWFRCKLDALVHTSKTSAVVIDYKTGKLFGNEIKHGEQVQLYHVNTFLRHPELEEVTTELWYLDADAITSKTVYRDQSLRFKRYWNQLGQEITHNTNWTPNANKWSCQWCPYGPTGSGDCTVGRPGMFKKKVIQLKELK